MKQFIFSAWIVICSLSMSQTVHAQSLKDLLNKDNIEKAVNTLTGNSKTVEMTGNWTYTGSAIELQSDNILSNLGGTAASSVAENKLNEQLSKIGITEGKLSFTFNADSTFVATVSKKQLQGSYSYDATSQKVYLKFAKIVGMNAKLNCTSSNMDLLFNADKLLKLLTYLSNKSSNSTLKTIGSLSENYDGMLIGFALKKEE